MEITINIYGELTKRGMLIAYVRKFVNFLINFDLYADFMQEASFSREKGLELPQRVFYPEELIEIYILKYFQYRMPLYDYVFGNHEKFNHWKLVNTLWKDYFFDR